MIPANLYDSNLIIFNCGICDVRKKKKCALDLTKNVFKINEVDVLILPCRDHYISLLVSYFTI